MPLITDYYKEQNAKLHRITRWGESGQKSAEIVKAAIEKNDIKTMLDYGCGRGTLKTKLEELGVNISIAEYDPAIPGKDLLPWPAELVTCTDVLEHVEPECITEVLKHLYGLTEYLTYFIISCKLASRKLPDGRNAHILVKPPEWWLQKLQNHGWKILEHESHNDRDGKLREVRIWAAVNQE